MIKIIVNAPKGGVGKTTLATNIALYLSKKNKKVWALDLAQGRQMTKALERDSSFSSDNKIDTREAESIPQTFSGARSYDYLVADTDDYFEIIKELANRGAIQGWKIIVPIVDEYNGLERIPEELGALFLTTMFKGGEVLNLNIIPNKVEDPVSISNIKSKLEEYNLEEFLSSNYISFCTSEPPYYIDNEEFYIDIKELLDEMGVI